MKYLLVVNALFEGLFGLVAVSAPAVVWAPGDGLALANGRSFGFAALTIAALSVLSASRVANRDVLVVSGLTLIVWHVGATAGLLVAGLGPAPAVVIHAVFTLAFVALFLRARSKAAAQTVLASSS